MKWITIAAVATVLPLALACDRNEPREVEVELDEAAEMQGANEMEEPAVSPYSGMENTTGESAAGYNEDIEEAGEDSATAPGAPATGATGTGTGSDSSATGSSKGSGASASGSATTGGSASGSIKSGNSASGNSASGNNDASAPRGDGFRLEHGVVPHTDVTSSEVQ